MRSLPLGAGLRRRIVASTALLSVVGMALLIGAVLLLSDQGTDREMRQVLSDRADAVLATTTYANGTLRPAKANDVLFDTLSWITDRNGRFVAGPRVPSSLRQPVAELSTAGSPRYSEADHWWLYAQPVESDGKRVGTVITVLSSRPYEGVLKREAAASIVLGLITVAGMTLLAWLIVRRALAPVARMTRAAEAWSQDRLEQRFDLGPPADEITALGAVLDSLLERVSQAIRAEQRLTAELAHELRTPLTVIKGEADLGRLGRGVAPRERDRFGRIAAAASDMSAAMTTLLDVARGSIGTDASTDVVPVVEALAGRMADPVLGIRVVPSDAVAAVPKELLERIVAPVLDNAVRYARSTIRITAVHEGDQVVVLIENDGEPVVGADEDLFAAGVHSDDSPGAGLGLALARRVARAIGGDVRLRSASPAAFAVTLPAGVPRRSTRREAS
ncbi:HAMP domain-containing sensor histidine kinase [Amnibacterium sp. CER49]|uniref:HAMP domain-containing sensor histidine kinase n=1 Tax=Amnibacterium sp. CER49 TaxID=3039161 RepID=UPI0024492499|nr:HAMP domain-containing sensor histidine kinase [Amnibacterium sp. CER49]MDH2445457.1 HAMP domain-containing sensor histidine kinase [Amnibacterium sp. CER49]